MGIYAIKPMFQHSLRGVERSLVRHHVHPDTLTIGAVVLSALGGAAFALSGSYRCLLLAIPAIAFVRTALNALDGMVATDTGVARSWGEVLNEFSDRLADVFLFAGLALSGLVSAPLAWFATIMVVLSEDIGVLSKAAGGPRQYGGIMGKADRMLVMSLAALLAYFTGAYWPLLVMICVVAIGCIATTVQRGRQTYESL